MGGIQSTTGLFSGINSGQLINQLIQAESRPKQLAQQRLIQLQSQQAAFLDLNSRVSNLKAAATKFGTAKIFRSAAATSTNADVLRAVATNQAVPGAYTFVSDRVVSSQQMLSRGFADRNVSGVGMTSMIFESARGRLDRDIALSELNGGAGVSRGKIVVTDSAGNAATIDLSRVGTVNEVIEAINANSNGKFNASIKGDHLTITDTAGGTGQLAITNAAGYTTATSLGIEGASTTTPAGKVLNGGRLYYAGGATTLASLNDGNGVKFNSAGGTSTPDLSITTRDGVVRNIDLGDMYDGTGARTASAASSLQEVIQRINSQSGGSITAALSADGSGLTLTDTTTGTSEFAVANAGTGASASNAAVDLGLNVTASGGTITGRRVVSAMNSTLASNLNGGAGLTSDELRIQDRAGGTYSITLPTGGSVTDIIDAINTGTTVSGSVRVRASLDSTGTGLILTDLTAGTGPMVVDGAAAASLGLATSGTNASVVKGARLQHRYVTQGTALSTLNGGRGVGTGSFEITDTTGAKATIPIGESVRTVADVITAINAANLSVEASVNSKGDGIIIKERAGQTGGVKLKITDTSGTVAKNLNLAGEATATGADNFLDGSYERTVTFTAADTLDTVAQKINSANIPMSATVISDGSSGTPFRLSLSSKLSGSGGRFTVDSGSVDLGFATLSAGQDARIFYGAEDPARGVLLSSTSNTFDGVIPGVRLDVVSASTSPVTVNVAKDQEAIVSAVKDFVDAFNDISSRIAAATKYDDTTKKKGALLGDSTVVQLRQQLYNTIQSKAIGVSGQFQSLAAVGLTVGTGGTLKLDEDALRSALSLDSQAVEDLFAAKVQTSATVNATPTPTNPVITGSTDATNPTYSSLGVMEQVARLADAYVSSVSGVFKARKDSYDLQIKLQNDRIADFDKKLAARRAILEQQFLNMEKAIGSLQTQQSALSGLASAVAAAR